MNLAGYVLDWQPGSSGTIVLLSELPSAAKWVFRESHIGQGCLEHALPSRLRVDLSWIQTLCLSGLVSIAVMKMPMNRIRPCLEDGA